MGNLDIATPDWSSGCRRFTFLEKKKKKFTKKNINRVWRGKEKKRLVIWFHYNGTIIWTNKIRKSYFQPSSRGLLDNDGGYIGNVYNFWLLDAVSLGCTYRVISYHMGRVYIST